MCVRACVCTSACIQIRHILDPVTMSVCESQPCQNGGTCDVVFFGYICKCPDRFTGLHCEFFHHIGRSRRATNDTNVGECNNATETGDCGYRNTGCSVEPWLLSIEDDTNPEDNISVALQYERTTEDCHYHMCIPCLLQSGLNASLNSSTSDSPGGSRRRRGIVSFGKNLQTNKCVDHI
jgi:hypothetical protein